MKYDLESVLACVKNDEHWIKKLVIGSVLSISTILLLLIPLLLFLALFHSPDAVPAVLLLFAFCFVVCTIIGLSLLGYCFKAGHDYLNDPMTKLPEWSDFWQLVLIGFKGTLGSILFYLPVMFLTAAYFFTAMHFEPLDDKSESVKTLLFCFDIFTELLFWVYTLFYSLFMANFMKDFNPFAFLNVSEAYKLLKGNGLNYFILVLIVLALSSLLGFSWIILALTIIGLLAIPFVSLYVSIMSCILTARFMQIANEPKNVEQN